MSESPKQYPLRMSPDFYDRLSARAAANARSMNAEIISLLEQAMDGDGGKQLTELGERLKSLNERREKVRAALGALEASTASLETSYVALSTDFEAAKRVHDSIKK